jgi:hypothetical protein
MKAISSRNPIQILRKEKSLAKGISKICSSGYKISHFTNFIAEANQPASSWLDFVRRRDKIALANWTDLWNHTNPFLRSSESLTFCLHPTFSFFDFYLNK